MEFRPGQRIIAGIRGELEQREYSIYSGEKDDYLEILVREVIPGKISPQLKKCKPGQELEVSGPFGSFGLENYDISPGKLIFIATGTGISPFHSFVRSYPGIDYTLYHGVRYGFEAYDRDDYDTHRYFLCTSRETGADHYGRVTKFLPSLRVTPGMLFYLCGNNNMIYDAEQILMSKGVPAEKIFTEIYF